MSDPEGGVKIKNLCGTMSRGFCGTSGQREMTGGAEEKKKDLDRKKGTGRGPNLRTILGKIQKEPF